MDWKIPEDCCSTKQWEVQKKKTDSSVRYDCCTAVKERTGKVAKSHDIVALYKEQLKTEKSCNLVVVTAKRWKKRENPIRLLSYIEELETGKPCNNVVSRIKSGRTKIP